jgi:hypothetical protein
MTPTPHLRFVTRIMEVSGVYFGKQLITVKVLQQWWDATNTGSQIPDHGAWRDVPMEEESK